MKVEGDFDNATNNDEDKKRLWKKEELLRKKEELLRKKEGRLMEEKGQLMKKEGQLRELLIQATTGKLSPPGPSSDNLLS